MKKIFLWALCIVILTGFSSCSRSASKISTVYPKSVSFEDYESRMKIRMDNKLDESFENAIDHFSYISASKLLSNSTENISYSPISLYMALSIASIGANGTTQDEMLSALGTNGKNTNYISEQNSKLFNLFFYDNEIGKLKIANSLWLQKGMDFKKAFMDNAVDSFYASLYNVDFADKNSSKLMGDWVSENTNGVISPQISIDKAQIMSILNTIYFKDEWIDRFDKDKTKPDSFYLSNGSSVQCDFMNSTYVVHSFTRGEGFTASSLALKNGSSMIFVLPDKGVSVESLLSTPEKAASLFQDQNSIMGKVIFQVPKFSYGSSLGLKSTLESMGIKSAFEKNADFSGITDSTAFISGVKQQTHVAIDEEGVEAAAFTQILYAGSAPPKNEIAEMILNRPFIFAIKSEGRLLFIGVVNNPAEKQP